MPTTYWENNVGMGALDVNIDADTDEHTFLYLTVKDEDGGEFVDALLHRPEDVDEFEQAVIEACTRFRTLHAEPADEPVQTSKKSKKTG